MSDKPTAIFRHVEFFETSKGDRVAIVNWCNHPVLGFERIVHTSIVLNGDENMFETLNTIYVKEQK